MFVWSWSLVRNSGMFSGYPVPEAKNLEDYINFIGNMPLQDLPEVFGLHKNADISYQINTGKVKV